MITSTDLIALPYNTKHVLKNNHDEEGNDVETEEEEAERRKLITTTYQGVLHICVSVMYRTPCL